MLYLFLNIMQAPSLRKLQIFPIILRPADLKRANIQALIQGMFSSTHMQIKPYGAISEKAETEPLPYNMVLRIGNRLLQSF